MGNRKGTNLHALPTSIDATTLHQHTWFETWFDSTYYHKLYQNHNDREASAFVDVLLSYLQPAPSSRMLDLGCGKGRHSKYLTQKGYDVTGIDLSRSSIREAKKWETPTLRFYRHDMRDCFGTTCYDYIFSFFTSFGYFNNWQENEMVIANVATALKKSGTNLLDYLNTPYIEKNLVAVEEKEIDGTWYRINRWRTKAFIYKQIVVYDPSLPKPLEYVEKVARFSTHDFERFFSTNGLKIVQFFGDYHLSAYHADYSERLIVLAKKS
jgi:SAM-dependent methyltransferase